MCGISAVVDARPGAACGVALKRMHELLAHRGPDGEGCLWVDSQLRPRHVVGDKLAFPSIAPGARFAAAFRWLKVQDLEASANQPMASPDRKLWLLFNGAIYNHEALRSELVALGHAFATRSDTEVILAAYRQWGVECLTRMRGMWAIIMLDLDRRRIFVARDRLGIKPLFYSWDGERLLLASEPKAVALARCGGVRAEPFRAHEFLRGLPPQSPHLTFFEHVFPVPAGTWAALDLESMAPGKLAFRSYWSLADFHAEEVPEERFEQKREEFEALLHAAVREHASAAVEVGTLLSGGIDTSMIARLLAEYAQGAGLPAPKTYSIIFKDPQMSEWPYMQLVLAQGGLRGAHHVLTHEQAWSSVERVVSAQGQPLLGQDIIAQYHAYELARQHGSTVVLDGQGADELLAGLPLHEAQMFPELLYRGRWLRFARELALRMRRYRYGVREALSIYVRAPLSRARLENEGLPKYDWLDASQVDSSRFGPGRTDDWGPGRSALERYLYRQVRHTNLPQVLMLQDHGSMSHAVESRVPFLDHRLVEFIFALPDRFKVGAGVRKRILLQTARAYLPPAIIERRDKRTFVSKITWMELRKRRGEALREMAASEELRSFGLIDPARLGRFVTDYLSGRHSDEMAVWRLYTFWQWLRLFRPSLA